VRARFVFEIGDAAQELSLVFAGEVGEELGVEP
jgi:hypothetical protein